MNRIEKIIYSEIQKNIRIRWSVLKRIIVEDKQLISERPFREILNGLVSNKIVYKDEIAKGHTEYYVDKEFEDIEKKFQETLKEEIPKFRKSIKHIKEFRNKISDEDLAGYFTIMWKTSNHLDFKALVVSYLTNNTKVADIMGLQKIKEDLVDLISIGNNPDQTINLLNLADMYLQYETDEMRKQFRKDWDSKKFPVPKLD